MLNQDRDGAAALSEAQGALEAQLFGSGKDTATWNGDALYAAIKRIEEKAEKTPKGASRTGALPPLYGSSRA